jgi:hypothetical protein
MFGGTKSRPLQAWLNAEATDHSAYADNLLPVEHGSPAMRLKQPGFSSWQKARTYKGVLNDEDGMKNNATFAGRRQRSLTSPPPCFKIQRNRNAGLFMMI